MQPWEKFEQKKFWGGTQGVENHISLQKADLYLYNLELPMDLISSGEVLWDYIPRCSLRNLLKLGGSGWEPKSSIFTS